MQRCHPVVVEALGQVPIRGQEWWTANPAHVSRQVSLFLASCGVAATAHQLAILPGPRGTGPAGMTC
jgi:hypothetical protein